MTRTPAIFDSSADTVPWSSSVLFSRSLHGLTAMPAKPPVGKMIWKVLAVSGNDLKVLSISSVKSLVWSRVALAEDWTMAKMMPWSSAGASSFCENM
jgi:hypothetical protein